MLRLLAAAALLACATPPQEPQAGPPAHPRVVWTEAPQTRATVLWTTPHEGKAHLLRLTPLPPADAAERVVAAVTARHSMEEPELWSHKVALDALTPWTDYRFVVESDGVRSRELRFRTAPADARPFAILQGGDSRSDPQTRQAMNRRIAALAAADDTIVALAHGGDYVYNGLLLAEWAEWMTDHELSITPAGRILPLIPARGNHEAFGILYEEVFARPGGGFGYNYFATQLSPLAVLITLNSETVAGGRQAAFLERTLTQHATTRWVLAQYHQPIWPSVKTPCVAKPHWQPIFERFGVDLVCEADGHALKRTPPIRGDKPDPTGVTYIGEGGLGVKQRTPDAERWYLKPPGTCQSAFHVWELRFSPEKLELRAHGLDGEVLDRHELLPRR